MRPALSAIADAPSQIGVAISAISATVITATASPRRPQRRAWMPIRMGQVAMTIAPAQITDRRNGSITQTLVAIIARRAMTPRVMRARSTAGGGVFT